MASFKASRILMAGTACMLLASCGGADNVASPGAGSVVIVPPAAAPTAAPTGTPPTANITAAQFASVADQSVAAAAITAEEQLAFVNDGSNNNVNGVNNLNGVYPTSATSAVTAADPSAINAFFTSTNFVGALNGPSDTAFQDWTCNSTAAEFGGAGARCTAVPAIGTLAAGTACPTGTGTPTTSAGAALTIGGFKICDIPQAITTSLTLPRVAGVAYRLTGQTEVGNDVGTTGANTGITLTIEPGVTVFGNASEPTADLLLVNRGSRISAIGTRSAPIIFTSQQNLTNNGVSDATQGQWGGIILLGRAPVAVCRTGTGPNNAGGTSTTCEQAIEGVTNRFYGGPNAADSSGQMSYVQIRYSGLAISDGNELQGLTLGGTGSGTVIDHIQSHNSADDGVEIFGGTTNMKYFVVTGADDDGFDIDNGYRGFIQFMIAAQKIAPATADSFATEIDSNNAEDLLPRTFGQYANFTFVQTTPSAPAAIRLRGGADMRFTNGIVKTPAGSACINMVAREVSDGRSTVRPANTGPTINGGPQEAGPPVFNSVYFACQGR